MNYVIINSQHSLFEEQIEMLDKMFDGNWRKFQVSSRGWTIEQQDKVAKLLSREGNYIVFASPVPYLLKTMSQGNHDGYHVYLFHNDNRDKVELPNGKIINKVASTGWQIV